MDERLYEDKLDGEISPERYKAKHVEFRIRIKKLEEQSAPPSQDEEAAKKRAISIVRLTQNAAVEFAKIERVQNRRQIIIELFDTIQLSADSLSVNLNKFVTYTNHKIGESMEILETAKTNNRIGTKNQNNRGLENKNDLKNEVYPIWQPLVGLLR